MRRYEIMLKEEKNTGINFFQRYLTVWVFLCMIAGVLLGHFAPVLPALLNKFEYSRISIPMAVLIWIMIYPMMLKVDFQSIRNVGKNPKGLFVTWIVNWLIKPFTMYGFASLFFFLIFKGLITPELATEYLAGAVLLGAAPCTAMVFILVSKNKGTEYFENIFIHKFDSATTIGLLLTLILIFMGQSEVILENPLHIVLIALPLIIQTFLFSSLLMDPASY